MSRYRFPVVPHRFPVSLLVLVFLAGCAALRPPGAGPHPPGEKTSPHGAMQVPEEFEVTLSLAPGQAWKSRFRSTSEIRRTFTDANGKKSERNRAVGLELVATQSVREVTGGVARIEVDGSTVRILQEGRFIDAPFLPFGPPNPVSFTVDTATGEADFSEMEKAYQEWMAEVRRSPAGDILGKTFRVESFVAQLKQLYGKPFTRSAGRKYAKGAGGTTEKELVLPFLGPAAPPGPVPVESRTWYEGFEVKNGDHLLNLKGRYEGGREWTADELADRLADFQTSVPGSFRSSGTIRGRFESAVDVLSGREIRSTSRLESTSSATFDGGMMAEEIAGKSTMDPAD